MEEFINSLNISIQDPYNGGEALPPFTPYTEESTKFWNDPTCCIIPFELNLHRYKNDSEKGYGFFTKPCACYNVISDDYAVTADNLKDLISNEKMPLIKQKIINGDYSLCKKCPQYISHINKVTTFERGVRLYREYGFYGRKIYESYKSQKYDKIFDNPLMFNLALDSKCNLSCPTCREKDYDSFLKPMTKEDFEDLISIIKKSYIVSIGCDGETFLNKSYMDILKTDLFTEESKLNKIIIYTNGMLANNTNFSKIHQNNIPHIREIKISIDAATEKTYSVVRPGGHWNTLLKNIDYLNCHSQKRFFLESTFTISKYNYKEVGDFVDFAWNHGISSIMFSFARPRFHLGKTTSDFLIDENHKKDIIEFLKPFTKKYDGSNGKFVCLI